MDRNACWHILGIAATADEREVKRAYAKLLKTTRPEDDPDAFQRLRDAFEAALWAADELRGKGEGAEADDAERDPREVAIEAELRPRIEKLADLNEQGTAEEAMAELDALLDAYALRDPAARDPLVWQLFEDGMLWVCCDIAANHDDFLRAACTLFGWVEPGNWLAEKDPKTVEWLKLRLKEADALVSVDRLLDLSEDGSEAQAVAELEQLVESELLVNVDVRHLFEAELMVGLSEFQPMPLALARRAFELFGWRRDHRHLEEYHPDAWREFRKKAAILSFLGRAG
ncbi:J domain-containing protein [Chitinimonas koreensis]|uniref:J domain-containing protein n=1 Tax=Chitinimonas koreensis TaxID=356302 RepID=UPI00040FD771|nr:J domain-containing protein [Chitinimonas koreensis]QNM97352.1 J domain-containing protein [Chitinimonas koreensis]